MSDGLTGYPEYRPSGVEWLGEVPAHWEIVTLRRHLRPFDGIKIGPFGSQLKLEEMVPVGYKVYGQANVIAKNFSIGSKFIDKQKFDELATCEIHPNDVVVSMMGTGGRCAVVPETASNGIMDSHLLRVRPDTEINPFYLALLIDRSAYVREQIDIAGKGAIMQGLNSSIIKNLVLALPPVSEQAAIVRFLEHADARIRRAVGARRRLIALLNEEKQAIIHRAVTQGLDPDVPLRPSGVEWLGDVPAHWGIEPIRRVGRVQGGKALAANAPGTQMPYLRVANVFDGRIDASQTNTMPFTDAEFKRYRLKVNDLLLNEGQSLELVGRTAMYVGESPVCAFQNSLIRVQAFDHIDAHFLEFLFRHAQHNKIFAIVATQTTNIAHLGVSRLANLVFAFPPLAEQREIVKHINAATLGINDAFYRAYREIDLLLEFRTRLIADVVTGKLDVRGVAAGLPETTPGQATLDAFDAPAGDEEDAWTEPGAALEDGDGSGV